MENEQINTPKEFADFIDDILNRRYELLRQEWQNAKDAGDRTEMISKNAAMQELLTIQRFIKAVSDYIEGLQGC